MTPRANRRTALLATASTLLPLAGCAALGRTTQTATVHLVNDTSAEQELYTDLTHGDEHVFGQLVTLAADAAQRIDAEVEPRTYQVQVNVDDVQPRPDRTTEWEISDDDCANVIYCTLTETGGEYGLAYLQHDCIDKGRV